MLRTPVKIILLGFSIFGVILGTHGLWVYFNTLEFILGEAKANKLYMAIEVPIRLQSIIEWMSLKGLQSWFLPVLFIFLGLLMWYWQSKIHPGSLTGFLRKLHLW